MGGDGSKLMLELDAKGEIIRVKVVSCLRFKLEG